MWSNSYMSVLVCLLDVHFIIYINRSITHPWTHIGTFHSAVKIFHKVASVWTGHSQLSVNFNLTKRSNVFQWEILGPRSPEDLLKLNQPPSSDHHHRRPISVNGYRIGIKPVQARLSSNRFTVSTTTTDQYTISHNPNSNNLITFNNIITTIPNNGCTKNKCTKDDQMIILNWKKNSCEISFFFDKRMCI